MAGRVYEDRLDVQHEDDGTLSITVEQPTRETMPAYICVEGNVALSVKDTRELVRRLELAIVAAECHAASRGRVAA